MKISLIASLLVSILFTAQVSFGQTEQPQTEEPPLVIIDTPVVIVEEPGPDLEFPRLEKIAEELNDAYEADPEAFLKLMVDEPIDYDLVNAKLNKAGAAVSNNSDLIESVKLTFDSVLTKAAHRRLTANNRYPNLPYKLPFGQTSLDISVKLNADANLPIPVYGFSFGAQVGQTAASLRGALKFWDPSWTDSYSVVGSIDLDSLLAIKKVFAHQEVQAFCDDASSNSDLAPNDLVASEKLKEAFVKACLVVAQGSVAVDFNSFLAEIKQPIEEINGLIGDIIDETWKDSLGGGASRVLNFVTKAAYSYKIGVQDCKGLGAKAGAVLGASCEQSLYFEGSGGAFIGDIDGSVVITENKVAFEVSGDISSGVRENNVAEKSELAAYVYIAAKVVESANDEDLEKVGTELASGIESIAKELQDSVNEETGEILLP